MRKSGIAIAVAASLTLGACVTPFTTSEGAAVLMPSKECVGEIVKAFTADDKLNQKTSKSKTPALDQFTFNLTERAKKPVVRIGLEEASA